MKKILFTIICLFSFSATALDLPPDKLTIQNGQTDDFAVPSLKMAEHLQPSIGIYYLYTNLPSQIIYKDSGHQVSPVVLSSHMLSLNSSIGLFGFLEAGFGIPVLLRQDAEGLGYLGGTSNSLTMDGLGDISLSLKGKFVSFADTVSLGASVYGTLPTGGMYASDGPTITPMALAGLEVSIVRATVGIGYRFMKDQGFKVNDQQVSVDGEFVENVGLSIFVWPEYIDIFGNFILSATLDGTETQGPMELLGGARGHLPYNFDIMMGGGGGLNNDVGSPHYRVFAGLSWSPEWKSCPGCVACNSCCPRCEPKVVEKIVEKEVIKEVYVVEKEIYLPPVYFDHDKSTVMAQSIPTLRRAVEVLRDNPQVTSVVIEGYADSDGKDNYNLNLSYARAKTVYDFIISYGIDAKRLNTISLGESMPSDLGTTKDAKARNRRVEFKFNK